MLVLEKLFFLLLTKKLLFSQNQSEQQLPERNWPLEKEGREQIQEVKCRKNIFFSTSAPDKEGIEEVGQPESERTTSTQVYF